MCLLLVGVDAHPDYKLIVAANRDEFFHRETLAAHWWRDKPQIFAGRDLQQGGTWLGVSRSGRFAALTNFRDPRAFKPNAPSRGALPRDFLASTESMQEYLAELSPRGVHFNPFNLILWDGARALVYASKSEYSGEINPGISVISNHLPDTPWPKAKRSKQMLTQLLNAQRLPREDIFALLRDRQQPPDEELPDTGVDLHLERELAPIFVRRDGYGTRCSTLVTVDRAGHVEFEERSFAADGDLRHVARQALHS